MLNIPFMFYNSFVPFLFHQLYTFSVWFQQAYCSCHNIVFCYLRFVWMLCYFFLRFIKIRNFAEGWPHQFTFYASKSPTSTRVDFYKRSGSTRETMLTLTNSGSPPFSNKATSMYAAPGEAYDEQILPSFT